MDARPTRCSICKHPIALHRGTGHRRLALIEDGLALCDVCATAVEREPRPSR